MKSATVSKLLLGLTLATAGCQTMADANDKAAVIVNPDDASRAALQSTVDGILNTVVTIAPDALTESSTLIIERNPPRTMQDPNPQGRNMDTPIQFRLVKNGADCILIDTRDDSRHLLENTSCQAEE